MFKYNGVYIAGGRYYSARKESELHNSSIFSKFILDLKSKDKTAIQTASKILNNFLSNKELKGYYVAVMPSHTSENYGCLSEIAENLCLPYLKNALIRVKTIDKLQNGGDRRGSVHLKSIEPFKTINKKIILIDDITTSGNSLKIGERLLYKAGAVSVIPVSIGYAKQFKI